MAEEREFSVESRAGYTLLRVESCRLDALLAPRLRSEFVLLNGQGATTIVLDMARCTHCDAAGLGAIQMGDRLCRSAGGKLVIMGLTPSVGHEFTASKLNASLTCVYSEAQLQSVL